MPNSSTRVSGVASACSTPSYSHLDGDAVQTRYSHLSAAAPAGSYLRGQIIGLCGNTGSWSTGPHLHFEAKPVHLLHSLDRLSAEQLDQLESHPRWLNQLREARR